LAAGLYYYIDDEEALLRATKQIKDNPKFIQGYTKRLQKTNIRDEGDFMRSINCGYLGDKETGIYHLPTCTYSQIKQENEVWDNDIMTFKKQQMSPCDVCKPPK
jgi:methylphosphotriester-DNA--protein-cysteine methyltransferase